MCRQKFFILVTQVSSRFDHLDAPTGQTYKDLLISAYRRKCLEEKIAATSVTLQIERINTLLPSNVLKIVAISWLLGAVHTSETNCLKHVAWNMKYLYDVTNQYILIEQCTLRNKKHMFLEIYFMKLIVLREEMLRNFRRFCRVFLLIQIRRLQKIAWNLFPYFPLGCKYVARNTFRGILHQRNMQHAICNTQYAIRN